MLDKMGEGPLLEDEEVRLEIDNRRRVYLFQVNYRFGENAFLPYSVGVIRAYCESQPHLAKAYRFEPLGYQRDPIEVVIQGLVQPDVVGLSCYVWNWEWNLRLGAAVRHEFPECLIVLGGPHVPKRSDTFFVNHAFVDLLVQGEGEITFAEILTERIQQDADYTRIPGLSVRIAGLVTSNTPPRPRLNDLSGLPSPYTTGVFDDILRIGQRWNASQETNRGCPYECTFCDWGSAVMTKVRHFSNERIIEEIKWFGTHAIDIIYNCDANYGMFDRDLTFAKIMVQTKENNGYPTQFRTSYAKKSNDTVFAIAEVLDKVGLQRGVGISLQSVNDETLHAVRRSNLTNNSLASLLTRYRSAGIPTYTELILGLPGESIDSFKEGVCEVLEAGQHESVLIYPCQVLPNSELADPNYIQSHGIRTVKMPIFLGYSSPTAQEVTEFGELVVETNTMGRTQWLDAFMFSWTIQLFHCLNITQALALILRHEYQISYRVFYEALLGYAARHPELLIGELIGEATDSVLRSLTGHALVKSIATAANFVWNPEEIAFLRAITSKAVVFQEITTFFRELSDLQNFHLPDDLFDDLINYQRASLVAPSEPRELKIELHHDISTTVQAALFGKRLAVKRKECKLVLVADIDPAMEFGTFALEALRYGRKDNKLRRRVVMQSKNA